MPTPWSTGRGSAGTSGAAGESAGLIHEIKSVRQIVDETIAGFWREIDRLAALRRPAL